MDISFRLYYLRMKHGCTKTAIAKAVGVSRRTVYAWERGLKYPTAEHKSGLARRAHSWIFSREMIGRTFL